MRKRGIQQRTINGKCQRQGALLISLPLLSFLLVLALSLSILAAYSVEKRAVTYDPRGQIQQGLNGRDYSYCCTGHNLSGAFDRCLAEDRGSHFHNAGHLIVDGACNVKLSDSGAIRGFVGWRLMKSRIFI